MTTKTLFEKIEEATEELELLTLAYRCEAEARIGLITWEKYVEYVISLEQKLDFEITKENLDQAAQKYLEEK